MDKLSNTLPFGFAISDVGIVLQSDSQSINPPNSTEIELCREWLRRKTIPTKTENRNMGSYGWKHVVEKDMNHYVSNGAFIQAALLEGYLVRHYGETSPNAGFNFKIIKSFREWISKQKDRDDPVGDLARDILQDKDWPASSFRKVTCLKYLKSKTNWVVVLETFETAWEEFERR